MTRCRPTGHQKHEYKIQEIEVDKEICCAMRVSRTPKGDKQHSISHIVENCVLFTGRMVKTV